MAWIEGTEERTFTVDAPYEDVVEFFCDPEEFQAAFGQMEETEEVEEGVWKWTLARKSEKGIKFQGIYTVEYHRDDNTLTWSTREGNMRSSGTTQVEPADEGARVHYTEKLEVDLPIPRLMAKVFKPIVGREVASGIGDFLDRSVEILEERAS